MWSFLLLFGHRKLLKQGLAAFPDLLIGDVKIAGVPRIIDIARMWGMVEDARDLMQGIALRDAHHVADVHRFHADQKVVCLVITFCHAAGAVIVERDPFFLQLAPGSVMDRVADFLAARCGGVHLDLVGEAGFLHEIFHDKFGHGAAADVAVANK